MSSPIPSTSSTSLWLRIIHINDVYELDNFPRLKTLMDTKSQGPDRTLFVLTGDFLGPSLLSSLDKGMGMVDCLNAIGVTHVCFGNHECDIPIECLPRRIQQSQFVWVNSNMQQLNDKLNIATPEYDIIQVSSESMVKTVALLGLLTNEEGLYRPGSFCSAKIEPIVETAHKYVDELSEKVDFILPMTHQSMEDDRKFAQHFGGSVFPIILGGHDHTVFDETHNGSRIYKTGFDAHHCGIIDLRWNCEKNKTPTVEVELVSVAQFAPDADVKARVEGHEILIRELEQARLFPISNWATPAQEFSTCQNRLQPNLGSRALTTMLRMGMRCQCALVSAGSIRGNQTYPNDSFFTWSDLKAEIPFSTNMVALSIPGKVLQDTIFFSRLGSRENPPIAKGGYIHVCNNIVYDDEQQLILTIDGKAFDEERLYFTAIQSQYLQGIDNHAPLLKWAADNHIHVNEETTIPAKLVVVELFSALLWLQFGSFDEIDSNGDGVLTREDIKARVVQHYGDTGIADLVVDNVMAIADIHGTGAISPLDMMIVHFVATDMVHHVDDEAELAAMKATAAHVLGKDTEHEDVKKMVERIRDKLDIDRNGKIRRVENMKALGELRRRSLLI
jgi:2',3'-cyclic-nucleotide 2'-phosphodiesterase (5'-nucleotidase family)